jgi:hypothetical protein
MIVRTQKDVQKANALLNMANITLKRLNESDKEKYPSNTLTDYYDIIHRHFEAVACKEGIKMRGEGAHLELIDYVCKKYKFGESTRMLLQELRDLRNRISYEGFIVNKNYIKNNGARIEAVINKLAELARA